MRLLVKVIVCLLFGAIVGHLGADALYPKQRANKDAIIRLHDLEDHFFCSATMISNTQAVTAAHCLIREIISPFSLGPQYLPVLEMTVVLQSGLKIPAKLAGISPELDQALISGDFTGLPHARIETDTVSVIRSMEKKVTSCGFPMGGALFCQSLEKGKQSVFVFAFQGHLYPGMSGGPVFNEAGDVVGTNYAATEDSIIIAGTEEEFVSVGVKQTN